MGDDARLLPSRRDGQRVVAFGAGRGLPRPHHRDEHRSPRRGPQQALVRQFARLAQGQPRAAFVLGADFIGSDRVALVLGDNIFYGAGFGTLVNRAARHVEGCVLFGHPVRDPERYGVGELDKRGKLISIEEKPARPRTNLAITGLYLYDNKVVDIARGLQPSERGELEITDVNRTYLERDEATLIPLGRGFVWLDTGTHDALMEAGQYVQILEHRQGVRIGCLEEIAWRMGYIDRDTCYRLGSRLARSPYGQYVMEVAETG